MSVSSNESTLRRFFRRARPVLLVGAAVAGLGKLYLEYKSLTFIPERFILRVDLDEITQQERTLRGVLDATWLFSKWGNSKEEQFFRMLDTIRLAAEDKRCVGLVTIGSSAVASELSMSECEEIREMVQYFSNRKKYALGKSKVSFAFWDSVVSASQVLLATGYDFSANYSSGYFLPAMPSFKSIHVKKLLDKLGVKFQVSKNGQFKSAMEMFTDEKPSESHVSQLEALYQDMKECLIHLINRKSNHDPKKPLGKSLFTPFNTLMEFEDYVLKHFLKKDSTLSILPWKAYSRGLSNGLRADKKRLELSVATLFINGQIQDGEPSSMSLLQDSDTYAFELCRLIRAVREDSSTNAVLLVINSPGGSAVGSSMIFDELVRLRASKPIVAKFGTVAASGGFMVGLPAHKIVGNRTSLTGSIGVISGKPVFSQLLEDLGVFVAEIGDDSQLSSVTKEWNEKDLGILREVSDKAYDDFLRKTAYFRGMSIEQVCKVAEGRVWSGFRAEELGLIDSTGGLLAAVETLEELYKIQLQEYLVTNTSEEVKQIEEALKLPVAVRFSNSHRLRTKDFLMSYNK